MLETIETQKTELTELKKKLSSDPGFHTVEYVEEKLEKKFEEFQSSIINTIKVECNKSYAAAVSSESAVIIKETDNIKSAIKDVRKEEVAEEKDKERRSKKILIHGAVESKEDTPTRNRVNRLMTQARRRYELDICSKSETKPKVFWSHVTCTYMW